LPGEHYYCYTHLIMKKEIEDINDIKLLVDTFYEKIKKDDLLGKIFIDLMQVNWDKHLPKMYDFWDNILFQTGNYKGRPFPPHLNVNEKEKLTSPYFERWINLFDETVDELFEGYKAREVKFKAANIKDVWRFKMDHINNESQL
jgi:hemoglobin